MRFNFIYKTILFNLKSIRRDCLVIFSWFGDHKPQAQESIAGIVFQEFLVLKIYQNVLLLNFKETIWYLNKGINIKTKIISSVSDVC